MAVKVLKRVARDRHRCVLPGWRQRRRMNLDYGSVVECDCGKKWEWSGYESGSWWADVTSRPKPLSEPAPPPVNMAPDWKGE